MTDIAHTHYEILSLSEFISQYKKSIPQARLYELSLPWLTATADFMLPDCSDVRVHCLLNRQNNRQESTLLIAWPLVHQNSRSKVIGDTINTLGSFYSSVTEPIFFIKPEIKIVNKLLYNVTKNNTWQSMLLGPFEKGIVSESIKSTFPYHRLYSVSQNIYQENIAGYSEYYNQRPSQLRNTIKRRERKLAKTHKYHIEIITGLDQFQQAFSDYKTIYQQSWKGNEFSYEFIEQVCLSAIAENKLRFGIMYIDEKPVAAQLWFVQLYSQAVAPKAIYPLDDENISVFPSTASIFKLAYVPEFKEFSIGSILSLTISDYVITQDNVSCIEFGMGNEPYKKDWLQEVRLRESYQVFNPSSLYGKLIIIRKVLLPRIIKFLKGK